MYLLIDQGNSRCKYVLTKSVEAYKAETQGAWDSKSNSAEELQNHLRQFVGTGVKEILVSSVASSETKEDLKRACEKVLQLTPKYAVSGREYSQHTCRTLGNSYEKPQALGVDRWLAMIAVFENCKSDYLVIDAGTAITADWVTAEGVHQGGHIVAGKRLLEKALLGETDGIAWSASHDKQAKGELLGHNTSAAVSLGADVMVEGYCRQLVRRLIASYSDHAGTDSIEFWVTGGDGEEVSQWIQQEIDRMKKQLKVNLNPELVFEGLIHWFSVNN